MKYTTEEIKLNGFQVREILFQHIKKQGYYGKKFPSITKLCSGGGSEARCTIYGENKEGVLMDVSFDIFWENKQEVTNE